MCLHIILYAQTKVLTIISWTKNNKETEQNNLFNQVAKYSLKR